MHQQVRVTPRVSSPASLPQTNPARTNNQREGAPGRQSSAGSEVSGKGKEPLGSPAPENAPAIGPPADSVKKLDQIVQVVLPPSWPQTSGRGVHADCAPRTSTLRPPSWCSPLG